MHGTLKDPFTKEVIFFILFLFFIYGLHVQVLFHYLQSNESNLKNLNQAYSLLQDDHKKLVEDFNESLRTYQELADNNKALLEENDSYKKQKEEYTKIYNDMNSSLKNKTREARELSEKNNDLLERLEQLEMELEDRDTLIEQLKLSANGNIDSGENNRDYSNSSNNYNRENKKTVYLTFDDGPSKNTDKILDILKEYNIKATFFVLGKPNMGNVYRRIVEEGHALGNHTYSHDFEKIYSSPKNFKKDIESLENLIYKETGINVDLFRFPGGSNNYMMTKSDKNYSFRDFSSVLEEKGYCYFDWNVDSKDAKAVTQDSDIIKNSVLNGIPKNSDAIILFHDSSPKTTTVEVLPEIIEELQQLGYSFDCLSHDSVPVQFFK